MTLRPYQMDVLGEAVMAFAGGARRVLVVLPPGAGKTILFTHLARAWGDRTFGIVAHRRELIRQAALKLRAPCGIIAPGHAPTRYRIQVGSVQTMARRLDRLPRFDVLVLDEAHHAVAGTWRRLLDAQPDALVLGVTGTPERFDGRGLDDVFDTLIVGPQPADLIAGGYLAPMRVFAHPVTVDFRRIRLLAGDYNPAQIAEAMDRPTITGDAVAHYAKHTPGQPAIVFCATVAHAEHVAAQFRESGWRAECVHGGLDDATRDARIGGLETAATQVLTSCDLISEGLDIPAVRAVLLLRRTLSLARYRQMIGRGARPTPGGDPLVVLDHAGNVLQHGMPDAPVEWTLAGRPRRDPVAAPPAVRQCPVCFAAHAPAPVCPACGHSYHEAGADIRRLSAVDGELVEVTARAPLPALRDVLASAATWEDMEAIRVERGYKPGWTAAIMAHRGGRRGWRQTVAAADFGAAA